MARLKAPLTGELLNIFNSVIGNTTIIDGIEEGVRYVNNGTWDIERFRNRAYTVIKRNFSDLKAELGEEDRYALYDALFDYADTTIHHEAKVDIDLGVTYRDKVTGFEGVATAYCWYMYRSPTAELEPKSVDGKVAEPVWFDVDRLERV